MKKKHFKQCALSETNNVAKKYTHNASRQLACFWNFSLPFTHNNNAMYTPTDIFWCFSLSFMALTLHEKFLFLYLDSFLSCVWYVIW
jgi:hypothetical protein